MKKDITDLIDFISKKTEKKEGELVSLCRYREDKAYIQKKNKRIKELEGLRDDIKNAEFHIFNFISAMDDETHIEKIDHLTIDHLRFMFEQWHMVKDMLERKIQRAKQEL